MGRPSKLRPEVETTLTFALGEGATVEHACDYAGIHKQTFYNWIHRGEADDPEYIDFFDAITHARGRGIVTDLEVISAAVRAGDWRAAAWRLAHRYPADYGQKVKIQGDAQQPLEILHRYGSA
jgi:transposase